MKKHNMVCAGIDTGKRKLDVALDGRAERVAFGNDHDGHVGLSAWLRGHKPQRIGIEASGGYEQAVVAHLRRDGFLVVVLQPAQVRAFAGFMLRRAKNDKIDAGLIATCAAAVKTIHSPPDERLAAFAPQLTLIEQLTEDIARHKTRRETCREACIGALWKAEIARLKGLVRRELRELAAAIRRHGDLAARLELIESVDGVGLRTAVAILVRMPEIGQLEREEVASLAGLAPFDDDSGDRAGARHIEAGRSRLRGSVYSAALPASLRWNAQLVAFYARLKAAGKPHKVALVACARKLLIFVNTVVARGTPWSSEPPARSA